MDDILLRKSLWRRDKQTEPIHQDSVVQEAEKTIVLPSETTKNADSLLDKLSHAFDAAYYLSQYQDVSEAGTDPFSHYQHWGWREKRRPNSWFDPIEYVARHPELVGWETNPLLHFLSIRKNQKRRYPTSCGL